MKRFLILFFLCLIPCNTPAAELLISVKYSDGTPAQGIKVREVQLERAEHKNHLLGLTDDKGEIKATFKVQPTGEINGEKGIYVYAYRYVVMPDDSRWEISDIFWNVYPQNEAPFYQNFLANYRAQNWTLGKLIKIDKDAKLRWNIVLQRGNDIKVAMRDQFDKPIRNSRVTVFLDLQKNSHTGFGAEIDISEVITDDNGSFVLHNAGDFYYSFDLRYQQRYTTPGIDYSSTVVMKRLEGKEDKVIYHKCIEKKVVIIVKSKITGKPIAGANIICIKNFIVARQGGPLGPDAITDANGIYTSNKFCTEHMVEFGSFKEGYKPYLLSIDQFISGKTYEFMLEPEQ